MREGHTEDLRTRLTLPQGHVPGEGPLLLTLEQSLFHSGKFSTQAKGLLRVQERGSLLMNPADAHARGLTDGDRIRLFNRQGSATTTVTLQDRIPPGVVRFPDHFDADVKALLSCAVDPATRVPVYRQARVQVEKETRRD